MNSTKLEIMLLLAMIMFMFSVLKKTFWCTFTKLL